VSLQITQTSPSGGIGTRMSSIELPTGDGERSSRRLAPHIPVRSEIGVKPSFPSFRRASFAKSGPSLKRGRTLGKKASWSSTPERTLRLIANRGTFFEKLREGPESFRDWKHIKHL
jgi:hypothetical protein